MKQVATSTILYVREKKKNSLKKVKQKETVTNNGML